MLRKSVETRDWLNTIEPRTVRAVMKRVVEDITAMDLQVSYTDDFSGLVYTFLGCYKNVNYVVELIS